MRKWIGLMLILLLAGCQIQRATFYVATDGSDANPGAMAAPFATLQKARDAVREMIETEAPQNITVAIRGGTYFLDETMVFGLKDSPSEGFTVTYKAYGNEEPVLSSGKKITGWKKLAKRDSSS